MQYNARYSTRLTFSPGLHIHHTSMAWSTGSNLPCTPNSTCFCIITAVSGAMAWTCSAPAQTAAPLPAPSISKTPMPDLPDNVTLLESPGMELLMTKLRDRTTDTAGFVTATEHLVLIMALEALGRLPTTRRMPVETPCGMYEGLEAAKPADITVVSIMRAGDALLGGLRAAMPGCKVGKLLIQRNETSARKEANLSYSKLPPNVASSKQVILVDPMLATGGSACAAIAQLIKEGVPEERIVFLNIVSCPEGLRKMAAAYPSVSIMTAAIDRGLNKDKYIVPGLGDYGCRFHGTD